MAKKYYICGMHIAVICYYSIMFKKSVLSGTLLAAAILCGGVCAAQDAVSLIPADAAVVMRISTGRILEENGGEEFLAKVMEMAGLQAAETVSSPKEWGVDTGKPVYVAISHDGDASAAVIMPLSDAALFGRTVQELCVSRVHRRGDVAWVENDGRCAVFDSHVAVAADARGERDAAWWRRALEHNGGGGPATEGFRRMMEADADIAVMVSGAIFDEDEPAVMKNIYGNDLPIEDISMVLGLSSGSGVAEMRYDVVAETDAAARYLEENTAGMMRVKGRYADCIPASSMFVMYSAIDGGKVSEALARLPYFADTGEDEDFARLRRIVESLSGDMAVVMGAPVIADNNVHVPATLMVRVADSEMMDIDFVVQKLWTDMPVEKRDGGYVVEADGTNVWIGVRDGDMVISTVDGMMSLPKASDPAALAGCRGSYGAFYLDVKQMLAAARPFLELLDSDGSVASLLSRVDRVEGLAERPDSFRCTVYLSDGEDNLYSIMADALAAAVAEDAGNGDSAE